MSSKAKIVLIYGAVAVLSILIIGTALVVRKGMPRPELLMMVNPGKQTEEVWFPIAKDLEGTNQAGEKVKLSDLKGKVWLVAEFFAVCPHCAQRNGVEMRAIYDEFRNNPDFQIVCISVDPQQDSVEKLKDYATALGAETKNWWFFNAGAEKATHEYLEKELKFFGIRERGNPQEIAEQGRFAHDLAFLVVNRNFEVIGKWPLAEARSEEATKREPDLYERLKADLFDRVRKELAKPETAAK